MLFKCQVWLVYVVQETIQVLYVHDLNKHMTAFIIWGFKPQCEEGRDGAKWGRNWKGLIYCLFGLLICYNTTQA